MNGVLAWVFQVPSDFTISVVSSVKVMRHSRRKAGEALVPESFQTPCQWASAAKALVPLTSCEVTS